ncbi:hypothetical protein D9M68_952470 [compost metagenome]
MTHIVPAEILHAGRLQQLQPGGFHVRHALAGLAREDVAARGALFLPSLQGGQGLGIQRDMPRLRGLGAFAGDGDGLALQVHVGPAQIEQLATA